MTTILLLLLSVVPTIGAGVRLGSLAGPATPDAARFVHAPVPVVIHVLSVTLYCLLGAFQFSRSWRLRWPGVHRRVGRLLAVCGLLCAVTGMWMTAFYPIPAPLQGPLLFVVRLLVSAAMLVAIVIAWLSVLRRDFVRHEAYMIRAYALGQGAGTQALVLGPWMLLTGQSGGLTRDVLMALSWTINIVVAELIIRRRRKLPTSEVIVATAKWT
jgi:hypothetical protein